MQERNEEGRREEDAKRQMDMDEQKRWIDEEEEDKGREK